MIANDRVSEVILRYAAKIGSAQDLDALLELNAAMARDLAGADRCSLWLIDAKARQLWTKVAHGIPEIRIPLGQGLVGACVAGNETILVNDTAGDARFLNRVDDKSGYVTRSVLAIPLRGSDGQPIGALQVLNKPGGFSPEDVDLLGLSSAYSASVLEAQRLRHDAEVARLMLRELEIARNVQQRLLPQTTPVMAGLDCAGYCRAAKFVGGDYYDFLPMADGGLLFTLGDVSGKGIAAAVLMAGIQGSLRAQVVTPPQSLATLMNHFNQTVYSFSLADRYSTLVCGLIDPGLRKVRYVNAGQVAPMLLRADGAVARLDAGGFPVGLLEVAEYEQGELPLAPGDTIVCFSDGITEATNEAEEMWDDGIVEKVLAGCQGLSAQDLIARLVAEADAFTGEAEQADDMTVVVLRAV